MIMRYLLLSLLTLVTLLAITPAQAQQQSPTIKGKVVDANSVAIPNASVAIYD